MHLTYLRGPMMFVMGFPQTLSFHLQIYHIYISFGAHLTEKPFQISYNNL